MPQFLIPAAISAGASLIGGANSADAAKSAADTQAAAADRATQAQQAQFQQTQANLAPYMSYGTEAGSDLSNRLFNGGDLSSGPSPTTTGSSVYYGSPTTGASSIFNGSPGALPSTYQPWGTGADAQAQLEQTPGYQFNLTQGLKGLGNSFAARGLGSSGAAQKGALSFASGLADSTFNQQLQNNMQQQNQMYGQQLSNQTTAFGQSLAGNAQTLAGQNQMFGQGILGNQQMLAGQQQQYGQALSSQDAIYQRLMGMLGIGQGAATGVGNFGQQSVAASNNLITGGAAAQAGGTVGAANAVNTGLSGIGNSTMQAYLMNMLFPQGAANSNVAPAMSYSYADGTPEFY